MLEVGNICHAYAFMYLLNCYRKRDTFSCLIMLSANYYFTRLWLSYIASTIANPEMDALTNVSMYNCHLDGPLQFVKYQLLHWLHWHPDCGLRFNPATLLFDMCTLNVHQVATRHGNYGRVRAILEATLRALSKYRT